MTGNPESSSDFQPAAPWPRVSLFRAAACGAMTGAVLTALFYLGERIAGLPFFPFKAFDGIAKALPGKVITFAIETIVGFVRRFGAGPTATGAKFVEQALALILFILLWLVIGLVLGLAGRGKAERLPRAGAIVGALLVPLGAWTVFLAGRPESGAFAAVLWLGVVFIGGGYLLGRLILETSSSEVAPSARQAVSRRKFLYLVGLGSFTVIVTAAGVRLAASKKRKILAAASGPQKKIGPADTSGLAASPPEDILNKRFEPVPGTRPELTENKDFYRVDINLTPPKIDGASWRLKVEGLVNRPLNLSLEELKARPHRTHALTQSCISNPVGGDLISTTFFTGVPLKSILDEAGLKAGAVEVFFESADGFYESVPLEEAVDPRTILVHAMNGEPLPAEHGFPLKISIPNHYGMKQPKWIVRMEVIDHKGPGFWVDRSWSNRAIPQTTSVIDVVGKGVDSATGLIPVGGIAWAGARGISQVEVQVDDNPWEEAELRAPSLGPLTWVQWRYFWKARPGKHVFRVRATDGLGNPQKTVVSSPHPDGATGLHEKRA
jgi:DMSO/TMAO reductase YedYZ molybdopterin-dependent catalytic subunit